jgi:hypothetical protein
MGSIVECAWQREMSTIEVFMDFDKKFDNDAEHARTMNELAFAPRQPSPQLGAWPQQSDLSPARRWCHRYRRKVHAPMFAVGRRRLVTHLQCFRLFQPRLTRLARSGYSLRCFQKPHSAAFASQSKRRLGKRPLSCSRSQTGTLRNAKTAQSLAP